MSTKSIKFRVSALAICTVVFMSFSAKAQTTVNLATVSSSGTGYTWASPVLTVNNGANLIITTNGTSTTRRIDVAKNATASITLNNCVISTGNCPIWLDSGARVTLTLVGNNNNLTAGSGAAGIGVRTGNSLTIEGSGSLTANGGGSSAGIGGSYGQNCGTITINGGIITAKGGNAGNGGGGWFLGVAEPAAVAAVLVLVAAAATALVVAAMVTQEAMATQLLSTAVQ